MTWLYELKELAKKEREVKERGALRIKSFEDTLKLLSPRVDVILNELALSLWGKRKYRYRCYQDFSNGYAYSWKVSYPLRRFGVMPYAKIKISLNFLSFEKFDVFVINKGQHRSIFSLDCSEESLKTVLVQQCVAVHLYPTVLV